MILRNLINTGLLIGAAIMAILTAGGPSYAGTATAVQVTELLPTASMFTFMISGSSTGGPACATYNNRFSIDTSTPTGQAMANALMTAFSGGKTVDIYGSGACNANQSNEEQMMWLTVYRTQGSTPPTAGGTAMGGQILQVLPSANILTFVLSVSATNSPSCGAGLPNRFSIDESTPAGQTMAAGVMTAFAQGDTIDVFGMGSCSASQGNEEQVFYVTIHSSGH